MASRDCGGCHCCDREMEQQRKRDRGYLAEPYAGFGAENRKRRRASDHDSEGSLSSLGSDVEDDDVGHLRIAPGEHLSDRCACRPMSHRHRHVDTQRMAAPPTKCGCINRFKSTPFVCILQTSSCASQARAPSVKCCCVRTCELLARPAVDMATETAAAVAAAAAGARCLAPPPTTAAALRGPSLRSRSCGGCASTARLPASRLTS